MSVSACALSAYVADILTIVAKFLEIDCEYLINICSSMHGSSVQERGLVRDNFLRSEAESLVVSLLATTFLKLASTRCRQWHAAQLMATVCTIGKILRGAISKELIMNELTNIEFVPSRELTQLFLGPRSE